MKLKKDINQIPNEFLMQFMHTFYRDTQIKQTKKNCLRIKEGKNSSYSQRKNTACT